jgi:DNA-binding transcriptional LysR family regulator
MIREIEIRHLKSFLAVADTLHFGRAATKLGIAQPNLSQQIMQMESVLGHALFNRNTRGVTLTPVGEFFQRRTEVLQLGMKDAIETAQRIGRGEEGNLVVGFSGSVMLSRVSAVIERFRSAYPRVDMQLRELHANEQTTQLLNGSIDISFTRDAESAEGLVLRTLSRESFVAILPERHRLANRKRIRPSLLRDEPFVLFSPKMARLAYERTIGLCLADGFRPNIVQAAPQWGTVIALVGAGMGVSLAPACIARMSVPGVVYRELISPARSSIDVGIRNSQKNPAAKILLSLSRSEFRTHPQQHS